MKMAGSMKWKVCGGFMVTPFSFFVWISLGLVVCLSIDYDFPGDPILASCGFPVRFRFLQVFSGFCGFFPVFAG
jgi:hypothetical protein